MSDGNLCRTASRRAGDTTHRRRIAWVVAVAVVGVGFLAWTPSRTADAHAASGAGASMTAAAWSPGVGIYGVAVGGHVTFAEDRVLTRGRLVVEGVTQDAYVSFTPDDGTDDDAGYRLPLHVEAGVSVAYDVSLFPACGVAVTAPPVFELDSRPASHVPTFVRALWSDPGTDSAVATDLPSWRDAAAQWCASGVHASLSGWGTTAEGGVTGTVTVYNPGPEAVTTGCAPDDTSESRWECAEVTIAGGTAAEVAVDGFHVGPDQAPPLRADDAPVPVLDS